MASFLITPNVAVFEANSLDEAVKFGKTLCVWEGTNHDTFITRMYPEYAGTTYGTLVKRKAGNEEILRGVAENECNLGMIGKTTFDLFQRDDGECKLGRVGDDPIVTIHSSFATKMDVGKLCTSLISYVLDLHMSEMKDEGFFDAEWKKVLQQRTESMCSGQEGAMSFFGESESIRLEMKDMWGIFLLHAMASLVAFILSYRSWCRDRSHTNADSGGDGDGSVDQATIWTSHRKGWFISQSSRTVTNPSKRPWDRVLLSTVFKVGKPFVRSCPSIIASKNSGLEVSPQPALSIIVSEDSRGLDS